MPPKPPKQLPLHTWLALKPFRSFQFPEVSSAGYAAIRTNELRDAIADQQGCAAVGAVARDEHNAVNSAVVDGDVVMRVEPT